MELTNCYKCNSEQIIKHGFSQPNKKGEIKQKYLCLKCKSILTEGAKHKNQPGEVEFIKKAILNEIQIKEIAKILDKKEQTIKWIIKNKINKGTH